MVVCSYLLSKCGLEFCCLTVLWRFLLKDYLMGHIFLIFPIKGPLCGSGKTEVDTEFYHTECLSKTITCLAEHIDVLVYLLPRRGGQCPRRDTSDLAPWAVFLRSHCCDSG